MNENKLIHRFHKLPAIIKFFISLTSSAVCFIVMRRESAAVQFMSAWVCFSLVDLVLSWITMFTAHPQEIAIIAKKQDFSRTLIFLIILLASLVSLVAIVLMLRASPVPGERGYYYHIALSIASVACAWLLIHTIFTTRYAHLFYTCYKEESMDKEHRGGLDFPNEKRPDYLDFAYFSFVIGMTFQVSDVQVSSSVIRRLVLLHGLISFLFNTIIVALSINIIATLIQK
jgi:uncharacterized membrane protein